MLWPYFVGKLFLLSFRQLIFAVPLKFKRHLLFSVKPVFVNLLLTYQCNSHCQMCNIWQKYLKKENMMKEELPIEDWKKFFSVNYDWLKNVRHLGVTGGEPFMRKDLINLVKHIRKCNPNIAVGAQTNGLLTTHIVKQLEKILKFYPDFSLAVSLDGVGKMHDKIRGTEGAYERAVRTIREAQKMGIKIITSGMTLSPSNYEQILKVKAFVESFGCEFSCFMADKSDYYFDNLKSLNEFTKYQKGRLVNFLKEFSGNYFIDNLRLQIERKRKRQLPCYSGWTSIVIDPYGNVRPCILKSDVIGNIKSNSLKEILTSDTAKKIRRKIKKCNCWNQCEVSTSAYVDPWDVLRWFLFYSDKKKFLNTLMAKSDKYA